MDIRGPTWIQVGIFMRKAVNHGLSGHCRLLDKGDRIDAIRIDFSKAFDLVPHDRLLRKIANSGVDLRVVA